MNPIQLLDALTPTLGRDLPLDQNNRTLRAAVEALNPLAVGAQHVTCSDEAEHETADSFQRLFCTPLLPQLSEGRQAPFRSANLGGRYEWKSARLAEDHFAIDEAADGVKVVVIRTSSHVGVGGTKADPSFGTFLRYNRESMGCGMMAAVLSGDNTPGGHEIRANLQSEGIARDAQIAACPDQHRWLVAGLTQARLQARNVAIDLMDYRPATPTVYLVMGAVTLNRPERDTEIPCAFYLIDHRQDQSQAWLGDPADEVGSLPNGLEVNTLYQGLGEHPSEYKISMKDGELSITDPTLHERKNARNHRRLMRRVYRSGRSLNEIAGIHREINDLAERVDQHLQQAAPSQAITANLLQLLLEALGNWSPREAALFLFAEGVSGIFHVWELHEIARKQNTVRLAREVVADLILRSAHFGLEETHRTLTLLRDELLAD